MNSYIKCLQCFSFFFSLFCDPVTNYPLPPLPKKTPQNSPIISRLILIPPIPPHLPLNNITPHAEDLDPVAVIQIVFEIEFVEPERSVEGCPIGRQGRSVE